MRCCDNGITLSDVMFLADWAPRPKNECVCHSDWEYNPRFDSNMIIKRSSCRQYSEPPLTRTNDTYSQRGA